MSSLHDAHRRRFYYLRLSITEVCNFRCKYCLPQGYQKPVEAVEPLSVDEIRNLVAGFARLGLRKVRLTGGEPTVRKDLTEIIRAVAITPGVRKVALTTNGLTLHRDVKKYREAGVRSLNVSVDSLDPARFHEITGMDRLAEILEGIEEALALGFDAVKLNAVLLKGLNDSELETFLDYVRLRPVTFRFIELMRTDERAKFFQEYHLSADSIRARLVGLGWTPLEREFDAGPAQDYVHPGFRGKIGLIAPYSKDFCSTCNRLRVSSTGDLRLCLFGEGRYSLRPFLQDPAQQDELVEAVLRVMGEKQATHRLHEQDSGRTRYLAEIGG